jgi:hypothetical protein
MNKCNLFSTIAITMLLILGGCSTSNDYCCDDNDLCLTTNGKNTSCSPGACGQCIPVEPLQIDIQILPDAKIGQRDYSVKLTASGGISPYTWSLTRRDEEKLKWLTITQEGDNAATIHNVIDANNEPLFPTELSDGIPLIINLLDSSKHGTDTREDNQGKTFQLSINVKDCFHKCKRITDSDDKPTANLDKKECKDNMLYTCKSDFGNCVKWDEGTSCPSNCKNDNVSCCTGGNLCGAEDDGKCEESASGGFAQVYKCKRDLYNCLVWDSTGIEPCGVNKCSGDYCGTCTNVCTYKAAGCLNENTATYCDLDGNQCPYLRYISCTDAKTCRNGDGICQYHIGDYGVGGGKIFYINKDTKFSWQYIEAHLNDQGSHNQWGCYGVTITGSNSKEIGTGKDNTDNIIKQNCSDFNDAPNLCYDKDLGYGKKDWFLPSYNELIELAKYKSDFGGFSIGDYWSSTNWADDPDHFAISYHLDQKFPMYGGKENYVFVRCARYGP